MTEPDLPVDAISNTNLDAAERFLAAFNDIEATVRGTFRGSKDSFASLSRKFFTSRGLSRHLDALGDFVDLRNLLAHGRHFPSGLIATPAPEVIAAIEALRDLVVAPPRAIEFVKKESVVRCRPDNELDDVLPLIADLGFSQIPVYDQHAYLGLLTSYAIARWLAARWDRHASIHSEPVSAVLEFAKPGEDAAFVGIETSVADVVALLAGTDGRQRMPAVIVTHSGSQKQEPLGIATGGDLPRLVRVLGLPKL